MSVSAAGSAQANALSDHPSISGNGQYIVFRSFATNLIGGDTNGYPDIYKKDRISGGISIVSGLPAGVANGGSDEPDISSDGSVTAFETDASNFVSTDNNGVRDIVLRSPGGVSGVSTLTNAGPGAGISVTPTTGDRSTSFQATATGTDPDGDPITYYQINWGDGQQSYGKTSSHSYTQTGDFNVTAIVCDQFNQCSVPSNPVSVHVNFSNRPPVASISVSPTQGDVTTTFSATMSGSTDPDLDPLTFSIDWDDGTVTSSQSGTHQYALPGEYEIVGTATDVNGASSSVAGSVEVCGANAGGNCVTATTCDVTAIGACRPIGDPIAPVCQSDAGSFCDHAAVQQASNGKSCPYDPGSTMIPAGLNEVTGGPNDDQLWGGSGDDIIFGLGGNDVLKGLGGNDILCGGPDHDGLNGGGGGDNLFGGDGRDLIMGAGDNDVAWGGTERDGLYGGPGDDRLDGGDIRFVQGAAPVIVDDKTADYLAGNDGTDLLTDDDDSAPDAGEDELYPETADDADSACAYHLHDSDPDGYLGKLGTFSPGRLEINQRKRPCKVIEGKIIKWHAGENDGDGKWHCIADPSVPPARRCHTTTPPGPARVTLLVEQVMSDPDPYDMEAIATGEEIIIEFMPRDYPYFPHLNDNDDNEKIIVGGFWLMDEGHPKNVHPEIHPAFYVKYHGVEYYSGRKYGGSPMKLHPGDKKGTQDDGKRIAPTNPHSFPGKKGANDWRYCWDQNGVPCRAWDPKNPNSFDSP